jgi:HPt (histidine-containing phosphotransfer) domain-containing protein
VAITASALKTDCERCLEVGISDFLSKPVSKEALLSVVGARATRDAAASAPWPPVDRRSFLEGVGGDAARARELIALFLSNAPALLAAVRESLDRRDSETLKRAAHELKGAMGNLPAVAPQDAPRGWVGRPQRRPRRRLGAPWARIGRLAQPTLM